LELVPGLAVLQPLALSLTQRRDGALRVTDVAGVVAEVKLRLVPVEVSPTDVVIDAVDAALQGPEIYAPGPIRQGEPRSTSRVIRAKRRKRR
jgi:hypothetical protein